MTAQILKTVLELSLCGTLLGLVLMLIKKLTGKHLPESFWYFAWLLVLLRFVLPVGSVIIPTQETAERGIYSVESSDTSSRSYDESLLHGEGLSPASVPAGTHYYTSPQENTAEISFSDTEPEPSAKQSIDLSFLKSSALWLTVWLFGVAVVLMEQVVSYLVFSFNIRSTLSQPTQENMSVYKSIALRSRLRVAVSTAVDAPMTFGLFRPLLILPAQELTPAVTENVMRHELVHFRRHDIIIKWFSGVVFAVHWFNPFTLLFKRELDRACELSCDEMLLFGVDNEQRKSYGETLLTLAERAVKPVCSAVTGFAAGKRDLKERLQMIMNYNKRRSALALMLCCALLLVGCGAVIGPEPVPTPEPTVTPAVDVEGMETVTVSNIDEFLAAIASDTLIYMEPGVYDLTEAVDYAAMRPFNDHISWSYVGDGETKNEYEINIKNVENLSIIGSGRDAVTLCTQPRYANVLRFSDCSNICIEALTVGHTVEPGVCVGGVIALEGVTGAGIVDCELYGCGTVGVIAENSRYIYTEDSLIRDCSLGGAQVRSCEDVRFTNCEFYGCCYSGWGYVFSVSSSNGFAVVNSKVHDCPATGLVSSNFGRNTFILGTEVCKNSFDAMFEMSGYDITVDGCRFSENEYNSLTAPTWNGSMEGKIVDLDGNVLTEDDINSMKLEKLNFAMPQRGNTELKREVDTDGTSIYHVSTVDEFLAAIGSDTTIYLDAELFRLDEASDYGAYGSECYYWTEEYDGPQLVISGVKNLRIIGGTERCEIQAVPRYANVLSFYNCEDIVLSGFTAGHIEAGYCSGGVLYFDSCMNVKIDECHLYGCGIIGLWTYGCAGFIVTDTEIYDCSSNAVSMFNTDNVQFDACYIHDCGEPNMYLTNCDGVFFDGNHVRGDMNIVNGVPVA